MDNKIKELETALAEAKAAKATAEAAAAQALAEATTAKTEAATASAKAAKFENRVTAIESEFLKLKEEMGKTVGDKSEPAKGPAFKNVGERDADPMIDAMANDLGQAYITSRPSNFNRK